MVAPRATSDTEAHRTPRPGRAEEGHVAKRVAFLVASEGIEQVELTEPWKAVTDAGHEAVVVSPEAGEVQMFNHLDKGDTKPVDVTVADAKLEDFDALVLPGGVANPDSLRMQADAVALVRDFVASGRHGCRLMPWRSSATSSRPVARSPRS